VSLSGPDAVRSIEDALRDIRREESEIVRRLGHSTELVTKIRTQEGELHRQMLATRLEPQQRASLLDEIAKAEADAATALAWHESDLDVAAAEIAKIDAALADASLNRAALQDRVAARDEELKRLAEKARPRLGKDAAYVQKLAAARELGEQAEASLGKTVEAEAARERNGRQYCDDKLFNYLSSRGFGTADYRASGLSRWLDGRVALLIGYERAQANYLLLTEIPVRLRGHTERLRGRAQTAALEIARLESTAVDSAGGKAPREAIEAMVEEIAALDRSITELEDARDEAIRAQRELAQGGDTAFANALKALTTLLRRADLRAARAEAQSAPKGQDTTIAAQLDDLGRRGHEEQDQAHEERARLRTLEMRRRDLEDLLYEIKLQGFDNPHSQFADRDLSGETLNVFLHGEINLANYWDRWRSSQTWNEPLYGGPGGGWGRLPAPGSDGIGGQRLAPTPATGRNAA
jgi:hypothetical protein